MFDEACKARKCATSIGEKTICRKNWWQALDRSGQTRNVQEGAQNRLPRYIATPRDSQISVVCLARYSAIYPETMCWLSIARDDDTMFGILHSRFHEAWALRLRSSAPA